MASQVADQATQPTLTISPGLIVGIVILAAFAVTLISASIFRYCRKKGSSSIEYEINAGGNQDYNPNRPRSAAQLARMKEVRWIDNMYAWERGREARMEAREIRPTTVVNGMSDQNKSWEEYTVADYSSGRDSMANTLEDYSGASYFYNVDSPYAPSSQQRFSSHLAPPSIASASYQTASEFNPRHTSILLPRHIYHEANVVRGPSQTEYQTSAEEADTNELPSQALNVNPKITINENFKGLPALHSPADEANFETIPLGPSGESKTLRENSTTKPPVFATHELFPKLSVSIYEDDEPTRDKGEPMKSNATSGHMEVAQGKGLKKPDKQQGLERETNKENVKGMIHEWGRANGYFARSS